MDKEYYLRILTDCENPENTFIWLNNNHICNLRHFEVILDINNVNIGKAEFFLKKVNYTKNIDEEVNKFRNKLEILAGVLPSDVVIKLNDKCIKFISKLHFIVDTIDGVEIEIERTSNPESLNSEKEIVKITDLDAYNNSGGDIYDTDGT